MRAPIGHDVWARFVLAATLLLAITLVLSFGDVYPW